MVWNSHQGACIDNSKSALNESTWWNLGSNPVSLSVKIGSGSVVFTLMWTTYVSWHATHNNLRSWSGKHFEMEDLEDCQYFLGMCLEETLPEKNLEAPSR